ncbi:MAG: hypothetical protein GY943_28830 [Chloroflexi bacterium]|nr:hypothetical protein [Chloroflexota bacterium]
MEMEHFIPEDDVNRDLPPLGVISTWFGVVLVTLTAVGQISGSSSGVSIAAPLVASMEFILIAFILASSLFLIVQAQQGVRLSAIPLFINVGTLIIIRLVPFAHVWEDMRYEWRQRSYEKVSEMVEAGELNADEIGVAFLPLKYRHLSAENGRIWISEQTDTTLIFFPIEINSQESFAGYLYRADGEPPQGGEFGGQWRYVTQKRPFWFFCVSY